MSSRNIKKKPSYEIYINTLKTICFKDPHGYIYYDELYLKNRDLIHNYFASLKCNYYKSKQFYLSNINFKRTTVVFKHLNKIFDILCVKKKKYLNGTYKLYYLYQLK